MERRDGWRISAGLFMVLALTLGGGGSLAEAQAQGVQMPKPGVPEIFTIQGQYVRVAYNSEGYSSLGYRVANAAVRAPLPCRRFRLLGSQPLSSS